MYILMAYFLTVLYTLYSIAVKCKHKLKTYAPSTSPDDTLLGI